MVGAAGLVSILMGSVIAYLADRHPPHVEALEAAAGALLLGGFALLGCALPSMI